MTVVDHLVAEVGTLGARDGQALGQVAARQRGDVVAAEHPRSASGQHHQPGDRVDQQLAPRRGDEVGIALDADSRGRATASASRARRRCRAAPAALACAAAPTRRAASPRRTTPRTGPRSTPGRTGRPARPVRRRSAARTPRCARRTAGPARPRPASFWVSLTASSTTSTGPSTSAGSVCTGPGTTIGSPSSGRTSIDGRAACDRTPAPRGRRRSSRAATVVPMAPGPTTAMPCHDRPNYRASTGSESPTSSTVAVTRSSPPFREEYLCCAAMPPDRCEPPTPVRR